MALTGRWSDWPYSHHREMAESVRAPDAARRISSPARNAYAICSTRRDAFHRAGFGQPVLLLNVS